MLVNAHSIKELNITPEANNHVQSGKDKPAQTIHIDDSDEEITEGVARAREAVMRELNDTIDDHSEKKL